MKLLFSFVVVFACGVQPWPVHCKTVDAVSPLYPQLRRLFVSIEPDHESRTVEFDQSLALSSPDLPASDRRVRKQKHGCTFPEQVRRARLKVFSISGLPKVLHPSLFPAQQPLHAAYKDILVMHDQQRW